MGCYNSTLLKINFILEISIDLKSYRHFIVACHLISINFIFIYISFNHITYYCFSSHRTTYYFHYTCSRLPFLLIIITITLYLLNLINSSQKLGSIYPIVSTCPNQQHTKLSTKISKQANNLQHSIPTTYFDITLNHIIEANLISFNILTLKYT